MLLFEVLERLVDLLIRPLLGVDLFNEVREALYVLASRVLHPLRLSNFVMFHQTRCVSLNIRIVSSPTNLLSLGWALSLHDDLGLADIVLREALDFRLGALLLGHQTFNISKSSARALRSVLGSAPKTIVATGALLLEQAKNRLLVLQHLFS